MNKAAFCRAFAGLSSMALLTLLPCPFAARADAADTAVPADVIFPEPCHTNAECVPASCCHASISARPWTNSRLHSRRELPAPAVLPDFFADQAVDPRLLALRCSGHHRALRLAAGDLEAAR